LRINNLLNIKQAKSASRAASVSTEPGGRTENPELLPGRLLKATVLDYLPNGKILLDIDGQQIRALSRTPLEQTTLWLEVQQGGETPILALAEKKGVIQQFLKFFLATGSELAKAVDLLDKFTTTQADNLPPELHFLQFFRQIITDDSGSPVNLLKLLHLLGQTGTTNTQGQTFTEQLANLIDKLEQQTSTLPKEIASLKKMADYLEIIQDLNQQQAPANQGNLFIYPCFFAGESGWGQWMFNADQNQGKEGIKNYQLNFYLEMSKIGELHCQLQVTAKSIQGGFFCASEEISRHFNQSLANLKEILTGLGYQQVNLSCRATDTSLLQKLQKKLEEKAGKAAVAIIDIKA
jgi:hypothetical protein